MKSLSLLFITAALFLAGFNGGAIANDTPSTYAARHESGTPLAGKEFDTEIFGKQVHIPPRNRDNTASITLGSTMFFAPLAGEHVQPLGAFYWKHRWDDTRFRGIFSIIYNEAEVSKAIGRLELIGHMDNWTPPFPQKEVLNGSEVTRTAIVWGEVNGALGIGLRLPVHPFQADNNLRTQLFYRGGWLYSKRTSDSGPQVMLPPDTLVHGPWLRMRYDGLWRNLLELPHKGVAAGTDFSWTRRDSWSDANYGGAIYSRGPTRDSTKMAGYVLAAGGIPGTSDKNRLLFRFHGGFVPSGEVDRFSAFRIGGGPFPTESDDLNRVNYPGAIFNDFPATDYLLTSMQYRREILFFLYGTVGWTHISMHRNIFSEPGERKLFKRGNAFSSTINSGFFWDSKLTLEFSHDTGLLRNGKSGSALLIMWSKEL